MQILFNAIVFNAIVFNAILFNANIIQCNIIQCKLIRAEGNRINYHQAEGNSINYYHAPDIDIYFEKRIIYILTLSKLFYNYGIYFFTNKRNFLKKFNFIIIVI